MDYRPIEVVPEDFYAVINSTGKNYHFTIWNNACAIKHFNKWGDKSMGKIISEIGQAAYLGTIAYWLLADEDRKDFKDEDDFNSRIQPYYAKQADFDTKVLKAMSIGMIPADDKGAADNSAQFSAVSDSEARRIYREAPKANFLERLLHISPKPKTNADKTVGVKRA